MKPLEDDYSVQVDCVDKSGWDGVCRQFSDANLYQTRAYAEVRTGGSNVSHLVLTKNGVRVAAAQSRIARAPLVPVRVAYVFWGPMWRTGALGSEDPELFRQAIRALRNEYVGRRRMVLRVRPQYCGAPDETLRQILTDEGFGHQPGPADSRTLVMDVRPPLEDLQKGFHQKWRNCLNAARKRNLEIVEGENDSLFESFETIHSEMQDRKRFVEGASPKEYRSVQRNLSVDARMHVVLCRDAGTVCAGAICSAHGDTGIYLFGATSNEGMKSGGSYVAQWRMLDWLKQRGCQWYNLNGINPVTNEGTYRFKVRLAGSHGKDVYYVGQYDAYPNAFSRLFVGLADRFRNRHRRAEAARNGGNGSTGSSLRSVTTSPADAARAAGQADE